MDWSKYCPLANNAKDKEDCINLCVPELEKCGYDTEYCNDICDMHNITDDNGGKAAANVCSLKISSDMGIQCMTTLINCCSNICSNDSICSSTCVNNAQNYCVFKPQDVQYMSLQSDAAAAMCSTQLSRVDCQASLNECCSIECNDDNCTSECISKAAELCPLIQSPTESPTTLPTQTPTQTPSQTPTQIPSIHSSLFSVKNIIVFTILILILSGTAVFYYKKKPNKK